MVERGYYVSFAGNATYPNAGALRESASAVPSDRILVETDSPYLSPEPVRGIRPNEPSHLPYTAACIAQTRGLNVEALTQITTANTRRFFNLPERV